MGCLASPSVVLFGVSWPPLNVPIASRQAYCRSDYSYTDADTVQSTWQRFTYAYWRTGSPLVCPVWRHPTFIGSAILVEYSGLTNTLSWMLCSRTFCMSHCLPVLMTSHFLLPYNTRMYSSHVNNIIF